MVLHKHGPRLYNGLVATLTAHLKTIATKIEATQGVPFLDELKRRWAEHTHSSQMIRDILMVIALLCAFVCFPFIHMSGKLHHQLVRGTVLITRLPV